MIVREDGQALVEYGLILFFITLVIIGSLVVLGSQMGSAFSGITASIAL